MLKKAPLFNGKKYKLKFKSINHLLFKKNYKNSNIRNSIWVFNIP